MQHSLCFGAIPSWRNFLILLIPVLLLPLCGLWRTVLRSTRTAITPKIDAVHTATSSHTPSQELAPSLPGSSIVIGGTANHMYSNEFASTQRPVPPNCTKYEVDGTFEAASDRSRYPWQKAVLREADRRVLYGTAYAQQVIWDHQHPKDCSKKKFLTFVHDVSGIGSNLHVIGQALALAMHYGRILVPFRIDGLIWNDQRTCPGKKSWECWFLPMAGCMPVPGSDIMYVRMPPIAKGFSGHDVPEVFRTLLSECSPVKSKFWFYWWRAQSIAYLVRFNSPTRKALDMLRKRTMKVARNRSIEKVDSLPSGAVSMHVRHGDKGREARLFRFDDYRDYAEKLANGNQSIRVLYKEVAEGQQTFTYPQKHFAKRAMFISTEDQKVIDQALSLEGWDIFYCEVKRPNVDVFAQMKNKGVTTEVLEAFLNLELSLEADAWVCTLSSNWCRLIDELRMTIAGKAGSPYINLATGGYPQGRPCGPIHPQCYLDW